jgi:hypothetical protein
LSNLTQQNHEGVIKFQLNFQEGPSPPEKFLLELNEWRTTFRDLGLIGQDPERYGGYGFGNLSRRLPGQKGDAFLISGTQTGHLQQLQPEHYATVHQCYPASNQLQASGQIKPSSEALSHGVLYQSNPGALWVMHLHSPLIFNNYRNLKLACTDPTAAYGTPEMAAEIQKLAEFLRNSDPTLLVMGGHQDGILAYGSNAADVGKLVVTTMALAFQS